MFMTKSEKTKTNTEMCVSPKILYEERGLTEVYCMQILPVRWPHTNKIFIYIIVFCKTRECVQWVEDCVNKINHG